MELKVEQKLRTASCSLPSSKSVPLTWSLRNSSCNLSLPTTLSG